MKCSAADAQRRLSANQEVEIIPALILRRFSKAGKTVRPGEAWQKALPAFILESRQSLCLNFDAWMEGLRKVFGLFPLSQT